MKKTLMRLSATILTLALLIAVFPMTLAADAKGTCGSDLTWELSGSKLTISGSGDMEDYTESNEAPWFEYRFEIQEIALGEDVASIGEYAFAELESLTLVECGGVKEIGDHAFYACVSLISVRMNSGVTVIGDYAFTYCYDLTTVVMPDTVERIGEAAFMDTSVYGDLGFGGSLKEIGGRAFENCHGLGSVTIPDNVEKIGERAFFNCDFIRTVSIGSGVTEIGDGAFAYCTELKTITADSENRAYTVVNGALITSDGKYLAAFPMDMGTNAAVPETVRTIGAYAFAGSYVLTSVTLPQGLETIDRGAFEDCWALGEITLPDSVTTIGDEAFASAYGLKQLTISENVRDIGDGAFMDLEALTAFIVKEGNTSYSAAEGILYNRDKTELIACPGGKTGAVSVPATVTEIGDRAFYGCDISSAELPEGLRSIGDEAFESCTELTGLEIPGSVSSIGEGVFINCPLIEGFTVRSGNAFYRSEDGVLYDHNMNELICYPAGKSESSFTVPGGVKRISEYAFAYSLVKRVIVPDSVTEIGSFAFFLNEFLTDVRLGSGVTDIGEYAFSDCITLAFIMLPESLEHLGQNAFGWCSELEYVVFRGQTLIDTGAFEWCEKLEAVRFRSSAPADIGELVFYGDEDVELVYTKGRTGWTEPTWKGYSTVGIGDGEAHRGDLNNDGSIDNADLITVARYVVNLTTFDYEQREAGDYSGDGLVDNADIIGVARHVVGL